jgi:hypothetical protein
VTLSLTQKARGESDNIISIVFFSADNIRSIMKIPYGVKRSSIIYIYAYRMNFSWEYTVIKKEYSIFLIYKEVQMRSGSKSYIRKGFLIYEEMHKYFTIYEESVSHI